jgi:hypothetical protein
LGGLVFAAIEFVQVQKIRRTLNAVETAKTGKVDFLDKQKLWSFFVIKSTALPGDSLSPITQTKCAAWSFEITQLKADKTGGSSLPIVAQQSQCKWIFFEGETSILAVKNSGDDAEMIQTFRHTSVVNATLPEPLARYLESDQFKEQVNPLHDFYSIFPSLATTFTENLIPVDIPIQVFGKVVLLPSADRPEVEALKQKLKLTKPLIKVTLGGENFQMALNAPQAISRKFRWSLAFHILTGATAIAVSAFFLIQAFKSLGPAARLF